MGNDEHLTILDGELTMEDDMASTKISDLNRFMNWTSLGICDARVVLILIIERHWSANAPPISAEDHPPEIYLDDCDSFIVERNCCTKD